MNRWTCLYLVCALALPVSAAHAEVIPGDVDGNGQVNVRDAQLALRLAVGAPVKNAVTEAADVSPMENGEVIGDGQITVADVVLILQIAVENRPVPAAAKSKVNAQSGLLFEITTPNGIYTDTEPIPFTVTLHNRSKETVSFSFPTGCQVDLQVKNAEGQTVWHPTAFCTQVVTQLTLRPGQKETWTYTWEEPREPGIYTAVARLNETKYEASITFEVVEGATEPQPIPDPEPTPDPEPEPAPTDGELAYLQDGSLDAAPGEAAGVIVAHIKGFMPDPSWAYDRTEIKISGDTLTLTPIIVDTSDDPVIQVLTPFETTVTVEGLESGKTYTVVAVGQDTRLTDTVTAP